MSDRGSASMEMVLLAPAIVLMMVFVAWCGRAGQTTSKLEHAADRGARAAALVSRDRMDAVGRSAALAELNGNGADCVAASASVTVGPDAVTVSVQCTTNVAGLSGLPGRLVTATSAEPIDVYRAD